MNNFRITVIIIGGILIAVGIGSFLCDLLTGAAAVNKFIVDFMLVVIGGGMMVWGFVGGNFGTTASEEPKLWDLVQTQNPVSKYWVLIDRTRGAILGRQEEKYPYVPEAKKKELD